MTTIVLQKEFAYVIAVVVAHLFLNIWLGSMVGRARKRYDVKLPDAYAYGKDAKSFAFNCYQRAHQNFIETNAESYWLFVFTGLTNPWLAVYCGSANILGRVIYALGYYSAPKNRLYGEIFTIPALFGSLYGVYQTAATILRN